MKYIVYHVGGFMPLEKVAEVEAESLSEVFYLTNTVENVWWENEGVEPSESVKERGGARSLSVGDVVFSEDEGVSYRVAPIGWEEVNAFSEIEYSLYKVDDDGSPWGLYPSEKKKLGELAFEVSTYFRPGCI